jgi:hypothetical protein
VRIFASIVCLHLEFQVMRIPVVKGFSLGDCPLVCVRVHTHICMLGDCNVYMFGDCDVCMFGDCES